MTLVMLVEGGWEFMGPLCTIFCSGNMDPKEGSKYRHILL